MNVPSLSPALDGILAVAAVVRADGPWSFLVAPDGTGRHIDIDPAGVAHFVNENDPDHSGTYTRFVVTGNIASCMPLRAGGPLPGARWMHYALVIVPVEGL